MKVVRITIPQTNCDPFTGLLCFNVENDEITEISVVFTGRGAIIDTENGRVHGRARSYLLSALPGYTEERVCWYLQQAAKVHAMAVMRKEEIANELLLQLQAWSPGAVASLRNSRVADIRVTCVALDVPASLAELLERNRLEPIITERYAEKLLLGSSMRNWRIVGGGSISRLYQQSRGIGVGTMHLANRAKFGVERIANRCAAISG